MNCNSTLPPSVIALVVMLLACLSILPAVSARDSLNLEEFVRIRCSGWNETTWVWWRGFVYGTTPQQRTKELFSITGFNVARCVKQPDSSVLFFSREIQLMLDPVTKRKVRSWNNPWTGEKVNVIHVSNDPVQQVYPTDLTVPFESLSESRGVVYLDLPLFYPNPLAKNSTLYPYSPYPMYQSAEFFKFYFDVQQLDRGEFVKDVQISWMRNSQWLPWMNMSTIPGQLFQSAQGIKASSFSDLPQVLQDEVNERMQVFRDAPDCMLEGGSETSWTYFRDHFSQYLHNDEFPIPKNVEDKKCESSSNSPINEKSSLHLH